jgi:hypothetical protein
MLKQVFGFFAESESLLEFAKEGDLASIERVTSTAKGRGRINTEKDGVGYFILNQLFDITSSSSISLPCPSTVYSVVFLLLSHYN